MRVVFLSIASGSPEELEPQVTIARRLQYTDQEGECDPLRRTTEAGALITALAKARRKRLV